MSIKLNNYPNLKATKLENVTLILYLVLILVKKYLLF